MKFADALTALIDQTHANRVRNHIPLPGYEAPPTRDQSALDSEQVRIAATVGRDLVDDHFFNDHSLVYGTFDNCREYGLTVSNGQWTFAVYEHRNSDMIHINGCPVGQEKPYGPFGGADKWDTLYGTSWRSYESAATALAAALKLTRQHPEISRTTISAEMKAAVRES